MKEMTAKEVDKIKDIAQDLLDHLGFEGEVSVSSDNELISVNIDMPDPSSFLQSDIAALWAFEHLVRIITIQQTSKRSFIIHVDINQFRHKKLQDLESRVQEIIAKVEQSKNQADLPPMNSYERRIVHVLVSQHPDLTSESIGEGETRRVVIKRVTRST